MDSVTPDGMDRRLIHALQVDGRAPFSAIAEVLDVSDQTVARRYRRLRSSGVLRVVGAVDGLLLGYVNWAVRLRCTPDAAGAVAAALARRPDTSWVHMLSGGTEIACGTLARTPEERDTLLLRRLPRTGRVVSMTAHALLHRFAGGPAGWPDIAVLSDEQVARLRPAFDGAAASPASAAEEDADRGTAGEPLGLGDADHAMLEVLSRDGRAGYAELSAATGWSESTVRRRMDRLRQAGVLYFDVDVLPEPLGYHTEARLWMSVRPADLVAVGEELARQREVTFAAATTGPSNLMAAVTCRTTTDLYRFLTERVGALDGVRHLETAPVIRTVKRAGALLEP